MSNYPEFVADLSSLINKHHKGIEKVHLQGLLEVEKQAVTWAETGTHPLPDLSHLDYTQLRGLKKRIKLARKNGQPKYRDIPFEIWSVAVSLREKEIGIGTGMNGRPPVPI